jgi:channel protein (hemolysin III family)
VLIVFAHGAAAKWAAAVFMATSLLLFGNSALYHRFTWGPTTKAVLKRIDHANILLLIAGTYTPIAVLALTPDKGALLLVLVWSGAILGILFRVFWINAPRWLYVALYLLLGWAAVMYLVDLLQANVAMMVLVIVGGLLYTGGASLRAEEAEPVAGPLRLPRDLPRVHGAGVPLPLDGVSADRAAPAALARRGRLSAAEDVPGRPPRVSARRIDVLVVGLARLDGGGSLAWARASASACVVASSSSRSRRGSRRDGCAAACR